MLLQTLRLPNGQTPEILDETPWHDAASNHGAYRDRLKQYLGGFFETDDKTLQPKKELLGGASKPIPDAVRLVDDAGAVIETYTIDDLRRDMGMPITAPTQDANEGT